MFRCLKFLTKIHSWAGNDLCWFARKIPTDDVGNQKGGCRPPMDLFYTSYPASFFPAGWMTKLNFDSASAGFLTFKSRKSSCGLRLKPPQDVGNRSFQGFRPILRRKTLLEWPAALTGWNELTKEVLFVSGIRLWILKPTTIFQPLNRIENGH